MTEQHEADFGAVTQTSVRQHNTRNTIWLNHKRTHSGAKAWEWCVIE